MMALKKAQQTGTGVPQAQQRLDDAEMAAAGVDEVLRRRQQGFNKYGEEAKQGRHMTNWAPYGGGAPDPLITAGTGAAIASHARAGRPISFPDNAQREFTGSDMRRAMHFGGGIQQPSMVPFGMTSAEANPGRGGGGGFSSAGYEGQGIGAGMDPGFMAKRQRRIDDAVAGLGRAAQSGRMQSFSGGRF
jgi:hypothetical protein